MEEPFVEVVDLTWTNNNSVGNSGLNSPTGRMSGRQEESYDMMRYDTI